MRNIYPVGFAFQGLVHGIRPHPTIIYKMVYSVRKREKAHPKAVTADKGAHFLSA